MAKKKSNNVSNHLTHTCWYITSSQTQNTFSKVGGALKYGLKPPKGFAG